MGAISQPVYGAAVFMAVATTIVAPPLLGLAYRNVPPAPIAPEAELYHVG